MKQSPLLETEMQTKQLNIKIALYYRVLGAMVYSAYFHVKTNVDGRLECSLDIIGGEKKQNTGKCFK